MSEQCRCGCGETTTSGAYAGPNETERNRHRARRQQQLRKQDAARERRATEHRAIIAEHGLLDLTLPELVETAHDQGQLAQALLAEVVVRASQCDERGSQARLASATEMLSARLVAAELELTRVRVEVTRQTERADLAEKRAAAADADAAAVQRRLDRAAGAGLGG